MNILKEKYQVESDNSLSVILYGLAFVLVLIGASAILELILSLQYRIINSSFIVIDAIAYILFLGGAGALLNISILKLRITNIKLYKLCVMIFIVILLIPAQLYLHLAIQVWTRADYFPSISECIENNLFTEYYTMPLSISKTGRNGIELPYIVPLLIRVIYYLVEVFYIGSEAKINYNKAILVDNPARLVKSDVKYRLISDNKIEVDDNVFASLLNLELVSEEPVLNKLFVIYNILEYHDEHFVYIAIQEGIVKNEKGRFSIDYKMVLDPHIVDRGLYNEFTRKLQLSTIENNTTTPSEVE